MKIKAVLFDLWNTLAYSSAEWRKAFDEAGFKKNKENDELFEKEINSKSFVDEEELAKKMCEIWKGLDSDRVKKLLEITKSQFFDDVIPNIKLLKKKGYLVGIISNTYNLEAKKLDFSLFDMTILSSEVGFVKPDKNIFLLACKELGVKPEECVFVGDNPKMDYEGSRNAGMKAILIDRRKQNPEKESIKDLNELWEVLENE